MCELKVPLIFLLFHTVIHFSTGMQDFNYEHSNCFDITVELTCCKYPDGSTLVDEWNNNKESMLNYIEAVHLGVKGLIKDKVTGNGIEKAVVEIEGIDKKIYSTDRGEYWRLLMPNNNKTYKMTVSADGYKTSDTFGIKITDGSNIRRFDVNLSPGNEK